ncbi:histidinol-phosphate transaminase [Methermicoccus shengliensis]|uniref:Histidinol-phosphate aminotransferase n=1 Tax=Methermicoccus shengliensis TaxID=660064 RepID=A0A832RUJ0_9EURY|nr:histidinol-phosphate transaminase [Methermicoccus shengliensis]KUK04851.1 MAG: Histidinol-phosphate aminotransferase [Euryarchaeota archaeon 55_53]KUK30479.1 MAG: Histidinol-phosphate aminotransferase [Methanosarcinales archeaon 56_1174]MDI3487891.1 histidinol-phosphate aminotransferase [Methanosarcinales archaeon]MDN5295367.1 histidinol-phosphate aminotransferase [Methanosarcinales archaeon]HIH69547.1 histidinol-phosphate transaminase [Methermicoccus shengliensis]
MTPPPPPKPQVGSIAPYVAGKSIEEIAAAYGLVPESIAKLASNENPYGPSPEVVEAIKRVASTVHMYPSQSMHGLRKRMAEYVGTEPERVLPTPGMDGLIEYVLRAFVCDGDEVIITSPTFSYYEIASLACGARVVHVPRKHFEVCAHDVLERASERTKVVFVCSPNNPTGNTVPLDVVEELADSLRAIVFVDEAYVEFSSCSLLGELLDYDNVVIGRTLSKAFGLAGLRVGYGVLPSCLMEPCQRVATPFALSSVAQAAAEGALADIEYMRECVSRIRRDRELLYDIPFKTYPSEANFVLVDVAPFTAAEVCERLLKKGIIVRDCTGFYGMGKSYVRISVGTREQTKRVVEAMKEIHSEL